MEPAAPTLTLVCGPMFAGKTTELIGRVECARAGGRRVLVAKPVRDVRYAPDAVVTHAGSRELAVAVHDLRELAPRAVGHDLVAIDELHFFADGAVAPIEGLLAAGTSVVAAGCDIDHFGDVFAPFDSLLPRAHEVRRIAGTCARCGGPSTHSERLTPLRERIVVGGIGDFVATCARCFRPSTR